MRTLGGDLAWKGGSEGKAANETGFVALERATPVKDVCASGD
jgi:hypothetical protein